MGSYVGAALENTAQRNNLTKALVSERFRATADRAHAQAVAQNLTVRMPITMMWLPAKCTGPDHPPLACGGVAVTCVAHQAVKAAAKAALEERDKAQKTADDRVRAATSHAENMKRKALAAERRAEAVRVPLPRLGLHPYHLCHCTRAYSLSLLPSHPLSRPCACVCT